MPKVSVVIPTYGDPKYLGNAISSVIQQTYSDLEIIIVDDNDPSSPNRKSTENIVDQFSLKDTRIIYLQHSKNLNGAAARNTGIRASSGEYISFLDSDDEYKPTRLEKCIKVLSNAPERYCGVYSGCEFRRGNRVYSRIKKVPSGNFLVQTLAGTFMFCTGSNIFMKRSIICQLSGFDSSFLRHQDYEFLVRYFELYSLIGIDEILVIKNNDNINRPSVEKMIAIKSQYFEKYKAIIDKLSHDEQNYIYRSHYISIAEQALSENKTFLSKTYYQKTTNLSKLTIKESIRRFFIGFYAKIIK